jgi:thiol-disulfide isomerase/thioredoxin
MKHLAKFLLALVLLSAIPATAQMAIPGPTWERSGSALKTVDFRIPMLGISDQGLTFQRYQGKPLLVYYFSSHCPHCKTTYPKLEQLHREFAGRGLQTIMVASGRNEKADIRQFMAELKVALPVLQDHEYRFTRTYNVPTVPMAFLISPKGEFIRYSNVHSELNYIRTEVNRMLPRQVQAKPAQAPQAKK